jgi:hypothetical protein
MAAGHTGLDHATLLILVLEVARDRLLHPLFAVAEQRLFPRFLLFLSVISLHLVVQVPKRLRTRRYQWGAPRAGGHGTLARWRSFGPGLQLRDAGANLADALPDTFAENRFLLTLILRGIGRVSQPAGPREERRVKNIRRNKSSAERDSPRALKPAACSYNLRDRVSTSSAIITAPPGCLRCRFCSPSRAGPACDATRSDGTPARRAVNPP